eukprot:COSAG01_NODE_25543_length_741_cov_1.417445_1_plen_211_part_10
MLRVVQGGGASELSASPFTIPHWYYTNEELPALKARCLADILRRGLPDPRTILIVYEQGHFAARFADMPYNLDLVEAAASADIIKAIFFRPPLADSSPAGVTTLSAAHTFKVGSQLLDRWLELASNGQARAIFQYADDTLKAKLAGAILVRLGYELSGCHAASGSYIVSGRGAGNTFPLLDWTRMLDSSSTPPTLLDDDDIVISLDAEFFL